MADRFIKVLDAASSYELMTLEEAKMMLGMALSDNSMDQQLQFFTDVNSAMIMRYCNRIFARERVEESWGEIQDGRIFLSHWPVREEDIENISIGGSYYGYYGGFMVDEAAGKISVGSTATNVVVTYTGGYDLPAQAPLPLKQAVALLNKQSYLAAKIGGSGGAALASGVRMIAHRDSRVMYHDPSKILQAQNMLATSGGKGVGTDDALRSILYHYMHHEV